MSGDAAQTRSRQDCVSEASHVPSERVNELRRRVYDTTMTIVRRSGVILTRDVDLYVQDSVMAIDLSGMIEVYGQFSISGGDVGESIDKYAKRIANSVPKTEPQMHTENGVDG